MQEPNYFSSSFQRISTWSWFRYEVSQVSNVHIVLRYLLSKMSYFYSLWFEDLLGALRFSWQPTQPNPTRQKTSVTAHFCAHPIAFCPAYWYLNLVSLSHLVLHKIFTMLWSKLTTVFVFCCNGQGCNKKIYLKSTIHPISGLVLTWHFLCEFLTWFIYFV